MAVLTAGFETGVSGNAVGTGDAGNATAWTNVFVSGSSTVTYDTAHVHGGSLAAKVNGVAGSAADIKWTSAAMGSGVTDHYGRLYLYCTANPASFQNILKIERLDSTNTCVFVSLTSAGKIAVSDQGDVNVFTTTNSIALNQWVRIEYHAIHSVTVGQFELKLFNTTDSATPTETQTSAANKNFLVNADTLVFGARPGQTAGVYWLDDIAGNATSYPGPLASGAFTNTVVPTVTGALIIGGTLTANPGTWTPTPSSYTYYWQRADDVAATNLVSVGTSGSTYTLSSSDLNKYLRAGVLPQ